jgi:hypothetical protein
MSFPVKNPESIEVESFFCGSEVIRFARRCGFGAPNLAILIRFGGVTSGPNYDSLGRIEEERDATEENGEEWNR